VGAVAATAGILLALGNASVASALAAAPTTPSTITDASAGDPPEIPVELIQSVHGGYLPAVEVSINGSEPIKMMIDTGTNILVTFPDAIVGANPPVVDTGIAQGIDYNGTSTAGTIATGTVSVGNVSTPQPVAFIDGTSCVPVGKCLGWADGIDGVIGIGQRLNDTNSHGNPDYDLYSALAQLSPELAAGYTVDFTTSNPVIRLGAPGVHADTDVTVPRPVDENKHYPTGQPVFLNPTLCWTISSDQAVVSSCNETVLDTGQSLGIVRGDVFDPVVTPDPGPPLPGSGIYRVGMVNTGAVIAFATSETSDPFSSVVNTGKAPYTYGLYAGGHVTSGIYNTGNGFYLKHPVGFDNDSGAVVIGAAKGTPSAPREVIADAADQSLHARWHAPEFTGDSPLTGFVITVAHPEGKIVSTTTVGADATSADIEGLENGKAYRVSVAAVNDFGVGAAGKAADLITPHAAESAPTASDPKTLAATGSTVPLAPAVIAVSLATLGLGMLARLRAQTRQRRGAVQRARR
jgi:hypothetical protein